MTTPAPSPRALMTWLGLLALVGLVGILVLLGVNRSVPTELWSTETLVIGALAGATVPTLRG